MPELPEVETVRRIIEKAAVGKRVVAARSDRVKLVEAIDTELGVDRLVGARLEGVERRAK